MQKGKFIVIEGLEGAGKSTVHRYVMDYLQQMGVSKVLSTREPGGTPLAEALRQLIKQNASECITDKAELLMLYAARVQLVENVIKPALNQGTWVVGDRHDWSSQAYQGGGRGMDKALLHTLKNAVLGDFRPDLTLYLDIAPDLGLARVKGRGELDRIEKETLDFFNRTREVYLTLVRDCPNAVMIQAHLPVEQVQAQIKQAIDYFLNFIK